MTADLTPASLFVQDPVPDTRNAVPGWSFNFGQAVDWGNLLKEAKTFAATYKGKIFNRGQPPVTDDALLPVLKQYEQLIARAAEARARTQIAAYAQHNSQTDADYEKAESRYLEIDNALHFVKSELTQFHDQQSKAFNALTDRLNQQPGGPRFTAWMKHITEADRADAVRELYGVLSEITKQARQASYDNFKDENAKKIAGLYNRTIDTQTAIAKAKGFHDGIPALTYSREQNHLTPELMDALDKAGEKMIDAYASFNDKKAAFLGSSSLAATELDKPLSLDKTPQPTVSWEQAKEQVIGFYKRRGFGDKARKIFEEGRIDARPNTEGKEKVAQVIPCPGGKAHVLVHFTGTYADVSNLAHEVMHAIHMDEAELNGNGNALYNMPYAMPTALLETQSLFIERAF